MSPKRGPYGHYMKSLAFTDEDIETLQLVSEGYTRRELADKIGVSEKAIDYRIRRFCEKLGALNVPHAVAIGVSRGIIEVKA